jgi:hypothetical protein
MKRLFDERVVGMMGLDRAQQDIRVHKDGHLQATLAINRLPADCLVGQERRCGRVAVSPGAELAHPLIVQLALRDSVSGRSNSTRSCMTFGVIRPRSPRSRQTRP